MTMSSEGEFIPLATSTPKKREMEEQIQKKEAEEERQLLQEIKHLIVSKPLIIDEEDFVFH